MPQKGPVRQEYVDAWKDNRREEVPEEFRKLVEDVVNRQSDKAISHDEHKDLPAEPEGE